MRRLSRLTSLGLAAAVIGATVVAGSAQTPPAPPGAGPMADAAPPPPPPPGPGRRPPPPPLGASIEIERGGPDGMRLVVHCAERDTTQDCASITTALVDKVDVPGRQSKAPPLQPITHP